MTTKKLKTGLAVGGAAIVVISSSLLGIGIANAMKSSSGSTVTTGNYAEIYETTGTKAHILSRISDIEWEDYSFTGNNEIHLDSATHRESLEGYGGAMTHSSAYLLENMAEETKTETLEALFGEDGARLNCIRIPIGTSDYTYTSSFYSLDDTGGVKDYDLAQFSIAKDEEYLIPALQDVLKINPDIIFVAAPWSAPAWMKTNSSLIGGRLIEGTDDAPSNEEIAFAKYLVAFASAYEEKGIHISYLSIENEPLVSNLTYPCMSVGSSQWARLVRLTGRNLKTASLTTKILAYDHNVGDSSGNITYQQFADEVSADEEISSYVGAFGLHCYSQGWQTNHTSFLQDQTTAMTNQKFFVTEVTESSGSGVDFALNLAWAMGNVTVGPEAAGASMSLYWNLVLTETGKPVLGNGSVCYGVLTYKDGKIIKNPAYYALSHVSKYAYPIDGVSPIRLDSYADNEAKINTVSYLRGDGAIVTTIVNVDATTYEDVAVVKDMNKMINLRIYPQSAVTIISKSEAVSNPFVSIDPSKIGITMTSKASYDMTYHSNASSTASFYLSDEGVAYNEADRLESVYSDGVFTFHLGKEAGDYTLYAIDGETASTFNLTLPDMAPAVTTQESGSVLIDFGFDTATSWSSYCDPYGKNVYRADKNVFDSSAEKVNVTTDGTDDPIYITATSYTDSDPKETKPFYFLVLTAKNGIETIVSYPLISAEHVFLNKSASMSLRASTPTLTVHAAVAIPGGVNDFYLRIKDTQGESYATANTGTTEATIFNFDLSSLTKSGVWYDIEIVRTSSATVYALAKEEAVDFSLSLEGGGHTYNFQEWEGILKINRIS